MSVTGTSWFRRNITSRWTLNQGSIQTSEPRADRAATLWLHISDTDISREKHDVGLKLDLSRSRCCMTEHRSTVKDVIFAFQMWAKKTWFSKFFIDVLQGSFAMICRRFQPYPECVAAVQYAKSCKLYKTSDVVYTLNCYTEHSVWYAWPYTKSRRGRKIAAYGQNRGTVYTVIVNSWFSFIPSHVMLHRHVTPLEFYFISLVLVMRQSQSLSSGKKK